MKICWVFGVTGLPNPIRHPLRAKRTLAYIRDNMENMIGVYDDKKSGMMVFAFEDSGSAIRSANRLCFGLAQPRVPDVFRAQLSEDGVLTILEAVNG